MTKQEMLDLFLEVIWECQPVLAKECNHHNRRKAYQVIKRAAKLTELEQLAEEEREARKAELKDARGNLKPKERIANNETTNGNN